MAKTRTYIPAVRDQTLTPDNFTTSDQIKIILTPYGNQNYGISREDTTTIN